MSETDAFLDGLNSDLSQPARPVETPVEPVQTESVQESPTVDPKAEFVESMAKQYDMSPEEYIKAVKDQEIENEVISLMEQGVTEEMALEILETRQLKAQRQAEEQAKQQQEEQKQNQEYLEFFDFFKEIKGRDYVPNQDIIPETVWEQVNQGKSLKEAYREHDKDVRFLKGFNSI